GRILAFQILRDLPAQKSARHRMIRISAQFRRGAVLHIHQQRTGVRTIQRADRVACLHSSRITSLLFWMSMQTRQLGHSDLHITPLGIGAWAMGGAGWAFSWGPQDDNDSIAAIRAGLERGLNWIDTAAIYGLGHSEEVVARAVDGVSPQPYVFTKCARIWDSAGQIGKSLKKDSVERECDASLKRLKVDTIDLYQIHWPEPD